MRILITAPTYKWKYCGIRDVVVPLVRKLAETNEVHVATTRGPDNNDGIPGGQPLLEIDSWNQTCLPSIANYVKANHIDIVDIQYAVEGYSHRNGAICLLPGILRQQHVACVVSLHELSPPRLNVPFSRLLSIPYGAWLTRKMLTEAMAVVSYSNWIPAWMNSLDGRMFGLRGCCEPSVISLGPTIFEDDWGPSSLSHTSSNVHHIVCFGLIHPKRDCLTVLRALQLLCSGGMNWKLTFAGAVSAGKEMYFTEMKAWASARGLDVEWTEGKTRKELREILLRAGVILVSQWRRRMFERGGIDLNSSGLRNAVWAGRPVIAPDGPFVPQSIRDNAILYLPGDPTSLASALRLGSEHEGEWVRRSALLANSFSLEAFGTETLRVYGSAIEKLKTAA